LDEAMRENSSWFSLNGKNLGRILNRNEEMEDIKLETDVLTSVMFLLSGTGSIFDDWIKPR